MSLKPDATLSLVSTFGERDQFVESLKQWRVVWIRRLILNLLRFGPTRPLTCQLRATPWVGNSLGQLSPERAEQMVFMISFARLS